jgi:hypothetical protein
MPASSLDPMRVAADQRRAKIAAASKLFFLALGFAGEISPGVTQNRPMRVT